MGMKVKKMQFSYKIIADKAIICEKHIDFSLL